MRLEGEVVTPLDILTRKSPKNADAKRVLPGAKIEVLYFDESADGRSQYLFKRLRNDYEKAGEC